MRHLKTRVNKKNKLKIKEHNVQLEKKITIILKSSNYSRNAKF